MLLQGHLGFYRDGITSASTSLGIDVPGVLGIVQAPAAITPTISISGYAQIGPSTNTTIIQLNQTINYEGTTTRLLGWHTLKGGVQARNNQFERNSPTSYANGQFPFEGSITNPNRSGNNTVNSLADFVLGQVKTSTYALPQPVTGHATHGTIQLCQPCSGTGNWQSRISALGGRSGVLQP